MIVPFCLPISNESSSCPSYRQPMRVSFLTVGILVGITWYFIVISICISLMTKMLIPFQVLIGHSYVIFLCEMCVQIFCPISLNSLFVILLLVQQELLKIYSGKILCQILYCKYFFPACDLPFQFPSTVFGQAEFLNFD